MAEPVAGSPEWWTKRLNKKVEAKRPLLNLFNSYYEGNHPLPAAPERTKGAFRRWMRQSRANWMQLVIDAKTERLAVQGIRYGADQSADDDAWAMWQANGLDTESGLVHLEAYIAGTSYVIVSPNRDEPERPFIVPAHPTDVVVETDPAMPKVRLAAFKKWTDDLTGRIHAVLYLPDFIYKLQSDRNASQISNPDQLRWEPRSVEGEPFPLPNELGVVPVVPFRNKPRLMTGGVSELAGVTDTQDRINETLFLRMMAGQYSAFRQRFATGLDIEIDEETGLPKKPFEPGASELWVATNENARFGDFAETSLTGYLDSVKEDIRHIAAVTSTPPHYLLGEMVNLAAEALKAAEAGLVSRVRAQSLHFGESWEEVWRLAFLAAGNQEKADVTNAEIIWKNPEFRTESQLADSLTKLVQVGILPIGLAREMYGLSPQQIARAEAERAQDALTSALFAPPQPVAQVSTNGNGLQPPV